MKWIHSKIEIKNKIFFVASNFMHIHEHKAIHTYTLTIQYWNNNKTCKIFFFKKKNHDDDDDDYDDNEKCETLKRQVKKAWMHRRWTWTWTKAYKIQTRKTYKYLFSFREIFCCCYFCSLFHHIVLRNFCFCNVLVQSHCFNGIIIVTLKTTSLFHSQCLYFSVADTMNICARSAFLTHI